MRKHVAPVIVVLNEISLREAYAIRLPRIRVDAAHRNGWNGIVFGSAPQHTLHPALTSGKFVQRSGRKGVRPRGLARDLPGIVQRGELRHGGGGAGQQKSPEKADVDPIILEVLV